MTTQTIMRFTPEERAKLERLARRAGLSFQNYIRARLDLAPRPRGGARANAGRISIKEKEFLKLQDEIARGHQDVDLEEFAAEFAVCCAHKQVAFDAENWDWDEVWYLVEAKAFTVDDVRYLIESSVR
jgi:hypothetical protein